MKRLLVRLGAWFLELVAFSRDVSVLGFGAVKSLAVSRSYGLAVVWELFLAQIRFTGVHGLLLAVFAALATGTLVLLELLSVIPNTDTVTRIVAHVMVKDLAPILTAIVIIGRSGTAMAIELANMKVNGEIDALAVEGAPLEHVLVLPRLLGTIASFIVLLAATAIAGLIGGYYMTSLVVTPPFHVGALVERIDWDDQKVALLKAVVMGAALSLICIREGLEVKESHREVPQVTTRAVVRSMIACLAINSLLSMYL